MQNHICHSGLDSESIYNIKNHSTTTSLRGASSDVTILDNKHKNHNIKIQEIIEIAVRAGNIAMQFYDKEYTIEQKQNKTPVTEVDITIDNFLIEELSKYNFPILSEEVKDNFKKRKNAGFVWIVDSLDGTTDFIQKTNEFSIMIGLANKKGESVLGVVYAPALDELYYAQKNKGAYLCHPGQREHLLPQTDPGSYQKLQTYTCHSCVKVNQSIIERETTCVEGRNLPQQIQVSKKLLKNGKILTSRNHLGTYEQEIAKKYNMKQIPTGSAGLKMCWIAKGNAELYINSSNKSGLWDLCAADIILTEADGNITDKNKDKIFYNVEDVILQNGYIISNK